MNAGSPVKNLAKDRAKGEDVAALVQPIDLAAGLLWSHV